MKKVIIQLSLGIFALGITNVLNAQEVDKDILNWYNGGKAGMRTEKAYKKLKKRESKTVIVAIIDSGIDIEHEDLKGKIWVNTDEIPGNGIDDDKNGYIDDVHGWNFLGNRNGENANAMQLERTRIVARYADRFEDVDPGNLSASERSDYDTYMKAKEELDAERSNYEMFVQQVPMINMMIDNAPAMIENALGKKDYTEKEILKYMEEHPEDPMMGLAYAVFTGELTKEVINEQAEQVQNMLDTHLNVDFDGRAVVGDDPYDFTDLKYGNGDVEGPDALHGTHVGGIVGAVRHNGLGGDGVAENVLLMSVRAVPDGDEYDKDIALAIRYAVDNGASVINMSFGKAYSPNAREVYDAFAYADSKGVLLVHAAGNDNKDIDVEPNYPTSMYPFQSKKLDHFLTIGASTRDPKKELAADFSNYGQNGVDVFAPGYEIYNSVPQSEYMKLQGTSMACPMVSGVAAMLKSYFPELSMKEIKEVILSTAKDYSGTMQYLPGTEEEVDFAKLSVTGGVVDVYAAVKKCLALEKAKK